MRKAIAIASFPFATAGIMALALVLSVVLSPVYAWMICKAGFAKKAKQDGLRTKGQPMKRPHAKFFENAQESLRLGQDSTPTSYGIELEIPREVRAWFDANGFEVLTAVMGNSFVRWPKELPTTRPDLFMP